MTAARARRHRAALAALALVAMVLPVGRAAPATAATAASSHTFAGEVALQDLSSDGRVALALTRQSDTSPRHLDVLDLATGARRDLTAEGVVGVESTGSHLSGDGRYLTRPDARVDLLTGDVAPIPADALAAVGGQLGEIDRSGRYVYGLPTSGESGRGGRVDLLTGAVVSWTDRGPVIAVSPDARYVVTRVRWPSITYGFICSYTVVDMATSAELARYGEYGLCPDAYVGDHGRYTKGVQRFGDGPWPTYVSLDHTEVIDPIGNERSSLALAGAFDESLTRYVNLSWNRIQQVGPRLVMELPAHDAVLLSGDGQVAVVSDHAPTGTTTVTTIPVQLHPGAHALPAGVSVKVLEPDVRHRGTFDLTLTVVDPERAGYLRLFRCESPMPETSNVNFAAGATVTNHVVVEIGPDGLCAFANQGVELVIDGGPQSALVMRSERLVDTRDTGRGSTATDTFVRVPLPADLPADTVAVAVNVTATNVERPAYVTAWPCSQERPLASVLNVTRGETRASFTVVAPGADRAVCVYANAPLDLVVDLQGTYPSASGLTDVAPVRVYDSRSDAAPLPAERPHPVPVLGAQTGPAYAYLVVTAVGPVADGFVTAGADCGGALPATSTVNLAAGATVAATTMVALSGGGTCVVAHSATHIVVDRLAVTSLVPLHDRSGERLVDTRGW